MEPCYKKILLSTIEDDNKSFLNIFKQCPGCSVFLEHCIGQNCLYSQFQHVPEIICASDEVSDFS